MARAKEARRKTSKATKTVLAFSTINDLERAKDLAREIVSRRLAACVNVVPSVTSIYRWQGALHEDAEALLILKTSRAGFEALKKTYRSLHPYKVPELIACEISSGLQDYLKWLAGEVSENKKLPK